MALRFQRFEMIAELGKGGMGTVYRVRDPQLEREVAVNVLAGAPATAHLPTHQTMSRA